MYVQIHTAPGFLMQGTIVLDKYKGIVYNNHVINNRIINLKKQEVIGWPQQIAAFPLGSCKVQKNIFCSTAFRILL